jgi:hypothetical protein
VRGNPAAENKGRSRVFPLSPGLDEPVVHEDLAIHHEPAAERDADAFARTVATADAPGKGAAFGEALVLVLHFAIDDEALAAEPAIFEHECCGPYRWFARPS